MVIICVINLMGANIRVTAVTKELAAGQKQNLDLHYNEITEPSFPQNNLL